MKVLILPADIFSTSMQAIVGQAEQLQTLLKQTDRREDVALAAWSVSSLDDLLQVIREEEPSIVHFFADENIQADHLRIVDADGNVVSLRNEKIIDIFRLCKRAVKLVLFDRCFLPTQAASVSKQIDHIIGIGSSVDKTRSLRFAATVYGALGMGRGVNDSYQRALMSLALEPNSLPVGRSHQPRLITREGADSRISLLSPTSLSAKESLLAIATKRLSLITKDDVERFYDKEDGERFLLREIPKYLVDEGVHVFSLAIFDIDKLTNVNQKYGRDVGDMVIKRILTLMLEYGDGRFLGRRCGDDTYFMLFPHIGRRGALDLCFEFRNLIKNYRWSKYGVGLNVSASFGIAAHRPNESIQDMAVRAAIGMNKAKTGDFLSEQRDGISAAPDTLDQYQSRDLRTHYSSA